MTDTEAQVAAQNEAAAASNPTTEPDAQQSSAEVDPIKQESATHKVRELTRIENEMMALLASFDDKAKGVLANASEELKLAGEKIREAGEVARRHLFGS